MPTKGHCLCGEIVWEYDGDPAWVAHCHCETCRRTCSAGIVTFVGVPRGAFRLTGKAPKAYASSPGVKRLFCGSCGAPVAYDSERDRANIHLYAAQHDDPAAVKPQFHVFHEEALPWIALDDGLTRYPKTARG